MKQSDPSGLSLRVLAASLMLASCAATEPVHEPAPAPAPVQLAGTTASGARPEFPGFTMVIRRGEELYCQKRNPTGSRARVVEACYTRDQMRKMAENSAEFLKQAEASGSHDTLRTDSPR